MALMLFRTAGVSPAHDFMIMSGRDARGPYVMAAAANQFGWAFYPFV